MNIGKKLSDLDDCHLIYTLKISLFEVESERMKPKGKEEGEVDFRKQSSTRIIITINNSKTRRMNIVEAIEKALETIALTLDFKLKPQQEEMLKHFLSRNECFGAFVYGKSFIF